MDNIEKNIPYEEKPEQTAQEYIPQSVAENTSVFTAGEDANQAHAVASEEETPLCAEPATEEKTVESQQNAEQSVIESVGGIPAEQHVEAQSAVSPFADSPYVVSQPVQQKPVKKRKKSGFWKVAVSAVLILALVASACGITAGLIERQWQQRLNDMESDFRDQLDLLREQIKYTGNGVSVSGTPNTPTDGSLTPAQVYAQNVKSVVMIYNVTASGTSTGSGFILSAEGHVVTNHHVIQGGGNLTVVTFDGREFPAKLVGSDSTNDVALLKVEGKDLQPATVGNSDDLIVGDQVVAIGNPLGELTSTLTVGYISAKERDVNTDGFAINMLQTDAAINSGNSGGPLFNMNGEVIGITTAKYSGLSSSGATIEGVGFAIPINDVTDILSDLMNYGYVTGAYLGVRVSDMDPAAASYYNMPVGVYVQSVDEGFAAERAGIQAKDIIVKLGDVEVTTVNDLTRALRRFQAGDEVVVVIYRSGGAMKLTVVLDPKPAAEE